MKDDGDITILADYTQAGDWGVREMSELHSVRKIRLCEGDAAAQVVLARHAQKIENAVLERAAKVCEQPIDEVQISDDRSTYLYKDCFDCAAEIRAMKVEK